MTTKIGWTADTDGGATSSEIDFGIRDDKARRIGGIAFVVPGRERVYRGETRSASFEVWTRALRDGQAFGAIPERTMMPAGATLEDAKRLGEKKLEAQRRRYVAKFGALPANRPENVTPAPAKKSAPPIGFGGRLGGTIPGAAPKRPTLEGAATATLDAFDLDDKSGFTPAQRAALERLRKALGL